MNFKKIVLSCAVIAGLSLTSVPQAKANDWHLVAGGGTGLHAGALLPLLLVHPIGYALDILCVSFGSSLAAAILSYASGSSSEQYTNNGKGNDFNNGFIHGFPIGLLASLLIGTGLIVQHATANV